MIDGIRLKVCGLTSLVDAEFADRVGADWLGFIFHEASPRNLPLAQFVAMAPRLPPRRKVAVSVSPSLDSLRRWMDAGFDAFQIHFPADTADATLAGWSQAVGHDRLWLAPKLPPGRAVTAAMLAAAKTMLVDTYHVGGFGGSGQTGDWSGFARMQTDHPEHTWILAGGLNPENIGGALQASGARFVDVNSGVERAPGVKDETKLKALVVALHRARMGG
jgi:phosphoribosylanthranilate isomerase